VSLPTHWLAAAAVSVVELDAVSIGQFMISRPLVVGPALGLALGRADTGLLVGSLVELFGLDELPVGGNLPINGTVAAASCLLLALGPAGLPLALALPAGLFSGWAHGRGESFLRQERAKLCHTAEESLVRGRLPRFGIFSVRSLASQACWTALLFAGAVGLLGPALGWFWPRLPRTLKAGLDFGLLACPSLAAAGLLSALWVKR
jgi:mannose/fructose/N-acetylgalactosamine-specific phosphotransferase system component IIC